MTRPRVGFLGVGWIGRNRMEAMVAAISAEGSAIEAVAIADPSAEMAAQAARLAPGAVVVADLDEILDFGIDGLVIASPSAFHADQSMEALRRGVAVFCQKPLGRTGDETRAVVDAARAADRLLGVDLSYRHTAGMVRIRDLVRAGDLGRVFAIDLIFHNAYGPDKPWFYDRAASGGGCVIDLGVHLVDLALWTLGFPEVREVSARLFAGGEALRPDDPRVEDYAVATLDLADGACVRLACSWRLPAGQDAIISADFYGTAGGARFANGDGGFYDFKAERLTGTRREVLASPPDDWGARAALAWARQLAAGGGFDPAAERLVDVADILDRIYAGTTTGDGGLTG